MPLYGWHSLVSHNKIAAQIKQKEQYVEAQIAPPRFSAYNLTTKWTFKPKRENLRLYFICSPPPAYSTMLGMSDAAKFGVYGQEWASWVFIRGCSWTILQGQTQSYTIQKFKKHQLTLSQSNNYPSSYDIATRGCAARYIYVQPNTLNILWCCVVNIYADNSQLLLL